MKYISFIRGRLPNSEVAQFNYPSVLCLFAHATVENSNPSYSMRALLPKSKALVSKDTTYCISYIKINWEKSHIVICHLSQLNIYLLCSLIWWLNWKSTPVFLPGEFQGQRILVGCSPWCCKELDMTEQLTFSLFFSFSCMSMFAPFFLWMYVCKAFKNYTARCQQQPPRVPVALNCNKIGTWLEHLIWE